MFKPVKILLHPMSFFKLEGKYTDLPVPKYCPGRLIGNMDIEIQEF
jgi:hypothetical protein